MEMKFEEEAEEFGPVHAWRLLHRSVVEGERVTVRCMGIQGRGVLVQTARQQENDGEWSIPDYDPVQMVDDVLIMEYMQVTPSAIEDGNGQPVSITRQIVSRELVGTRMAKERFQPKVKGKKPQQPGPYDHLSIMAGVVLTMETAPRAPIQVPTVQTPPPAEA